MHRGKAKRIAKRSLRYRKTGRMIFDAADRAEADNEFAQNVSHASIGVASSDVSDPLSIDRRIDKRRAPKHCGHRRMLVGNSAKSVVPHKAHPRGHQRRKGAVHDRQVQSMKVGNVAGKKKEVIWRLPSPVILVEPIRPSSTTNESIGWSPSRRMSVT